MGWIKEAPPAAPAPTQQTAPVKPAKPAQLASVQKPAAATVKEAAKSKKVIAEKVSILPEQKIEGNFSTFTFNPNNGILEKISFLKYFQQDYKTPIQFKENLPP
ncbi:MAG: hypothetical protein KAS17_11230, partial [Victivallaceae bacterium]|nr:hypothetical protein [Victivallaceae bacterium]